MLERIILVTVRKCSSWNCDHAAYCPG